MKPEPDRGEVWLADLPEYGTRPAVILTRGHMIPRLTSVTVAPITTTRRGIETEVPLTPREHGVTKPSVVTCDNLVTVEKSVLVRRLGRLDVDTMNAVVEAIHVALALAW